MKFFEGVKGGLISSVRAVRRTIFQWSAPGRTRLGPQFIVGPGSRIARGVHLDVGTRVSIGANFVCEANLTVGNDVMISSNVAFVGNDHKFEDPKLTLHEQGHHPVSCIHLEGDNLIGFGTIIVGSVRIGRGCIVGAGSLVTKDLPADTICVGRPARPIRRRR